ncbi:MAG: UvrD-helicase domain-containing protein [Candidatus Andersenbacteria bacterium]
MPRLDSVQQAAVTSAAARLSIVAPAGSGKTSVLIQRIAWLVQARRAAAHQILVVTFARKAAHELRRRLVDAGYPAVAVRTFHAWALRLLQGSHVVSGRLILEAERRRLLWKIACRILTAPRTTRHARELCVQQNWSHPFLVRQLLESHQRLTQVGLTAACNKLKTIAQQDSFAWLVVHLMQVYQTVLEHHGVTDFTHLIQAAQQHGPFKTCQPQHVLIDEAQDAAAAELQLIDTYCKMADTQTWVGDPNQSLYGWRGSAGTVPNGYGEGTTRLWQQLVLRTNYRSSATIIALVNRFLQRVEGLPILPTRGEGVVPECITYPRYGEDLLCLRVLAELLAKGFAQNEIVLLARAHLPLAQLKRARIRYPKVRALTVHAFKGLEARVVILLNVAQNRFGFPARASGEAYSAGPCGPLSAIDQLAGYDRVREERNIFYVALTRARDRLVICVPQGEPTPFTTGFTRRVVRRVTLASTYP